MGCQVSGYASDISRTYPLGHNSTFSTEQRQIYSLVLKAQLHAIHSVKSGASFVSISEEVSKIILEGLLQIGLLKGGTTGGETVDSLYAKQIHRSFMPHSLGHYLGLNVHDRHLPHVDKPKGVPISQEGNLRPGMVFTVEPGVYFIQSLLKELVNKHPLLVDANLIQQFLSVGGVRIEDNIAIHPETELVENLTTAPKEIDPLLFPGSNCPAALHSFVQNIIQLV